MQMMIRVIGFAAAVWNFAVPASAQTVRAINTLPPDWAGTITHAYDIRLVDVSEDGRTIVGYVTSTNATSPCAPADGSHGGPYEVFWLPIWVQAPLMEPFVIRDGVMRFLPIQPFGGVYGGFANRVSRDGLVIVGGRRTSLTSCALPGLDSFETVKWTLDGTMTALGIPGSMPSAVSADGSMISGLRNTSGWQSYLWVNGVVSSPAGFVYGWSADGTQAVMEFFPRPDWQPSDMCISGDGLVRFGSFTNGESCFYDQFCRTVAGITTIFGEESCYWRFQETNGDGSLAIARHDGTGPGAWTQTLMWVQDTGFVDVTAYFDPRGANLHPFADWGGSPVCLIAMNDSATVFVGYARGGENFGGGGPDTGLIIDLRPRCGSADFNNDGDLGTDADIEAFFACLAGNCCATCGGADFNGDGDTGTDADIEAFFRVLAGGSC